VRTRGSVVNTHGVTVPTIDTNAILHNIFWGVRINPDTNSLSLVRFNRGAMEDFIDDLSAPTAFSDLNIAAFVSNPAGLNLPGGPLQALRCNYAMAGATAADKADIDKVCTKGNLMMP
jgi:hypothetical protein